MPVIPCDLLDPWTKRVTGARDITVDPADVMRSAAIVGLPLLATDLTRERPLLEMMWRMMMVRTNLKPTTTGSAWTRSESYDLLDPSEKVAVSYFLGMVQSHLVATKELGYSHLVHVDRLLKAAGQPLQNSRPDFVAIHLGPNGKRTHAATWEAKGRTNGFDSGALNTAKDQAKVIPLIKGLKARETVASEAYFHPKTTVWSAKLKDPDWEGEELEIGLETYLLAYYSPLVKAGRQTQQMEVVGEDTVFTVPDFSMTIGLPTELVVAVDECVKVEADARDEQKLITRAVRTLMVQRGAKSSDLVSTTFTGEWV